MTGSLPIFNECVKNVRDTEMAFSLGARYACLTISLRRLLTKVSRYRPLACNYHKVTASFGIVPLKLKQSAPVLMTMRCQDRAVSKYYVITSMTVSQRSTAVVGTDVRASPNSSKVVIAMVITDSHRQFARDHQRLLFTGQRWGVCSVLFFVSDWDSEANVCAARILHLKPHPNFAVAITNSLTQYCNRSRGY